MTTELGDKLTTVEREALDEALMDDQDRVRGFKRTRQNGSEGDSPPTIYEVVERMLTARRATAPTGGEDRG